MMEITMARGDLEIRQFRILDTDGEPFTDALDEIYFTVKREAAFPDYVIQKRLGNGEIVPMGDGVYQFTIEPEDTDGLEFRSYDFDIELVINGQLKKTYLGRLNLLKEVTHAVNEVTGA